MYHLPGNIPQPANRTFRATVYEQRSGHSHVEAITDEVCELQVCHFQQYDLLLITLLRYQRCVQVVIDENFRMKQETEEEVIVFNPETAYRFIFKSADVAFAFVSVISYSIDAVIIAKQSPYKGAVESDRRGFSLGAPPSFDGRDFAYATKAARDPFRSYHQPQPHHDPRDQSSGVLRPSLLPVLSHPASGMVLTKESKDVSRTDPSHALPWQGSQAPGVFAAWPEEWMGPMVNHKSTSLRNQPSDAENLCDILAEAVEKGNVEMAREIATKLAELRTPVTVQLIRGDISSSQQQFNIHIQVEDKTGPGPALKLKVMPATTTVGMLKFQIFEQYGFPVPIQRLVIGKRISKDNETLKSLGIKTAGMRIYLYLLSASTVGLKSKQQIKDEAVDKETQTDPFLVSPRLKENLFAGSGEPFAAGASPEWHGERMPRSNPYATSGPENYYRPREGATEFALRPAIGLQTQNRGYPGNSHDRGFYQDQPFDARVALPSVHPNELARPSFNEGEKVSDALRNAPVRAPVASVTPAVPIVALRDAKDVWQCRNCTFSNPATFPSCKSCMDDRPADYVVPANPILDPEEKARLYRENLQEQQAIEFELQQRRDEQALACANYAIMLEAANERLLPNQVDFDCPVCITMIKTGEGVMLRECLHSFCKQCLTETLKTSNEAQVSCPLNDGHPCPAVITDMEVRALLKPEEYHAYLQRGLAIAESRSPNSFHCRKPNCVGWCEYEDEVNFFMCPVCATLNCLTCKAIHEGMSCQQYQEDLKIRAANDDAAQKTHRMLQELVTRGEAMSCPTCKVILQKKSGCDWMRCTMCKTEICWATKGPRWGPKGPSDNTGGCKCRVGGQKCTAGCGNCH